MASVRDLAKFSAMTYSSNQTGYGDWKVLVRIGDKSGLGFNAGIFINTTLNEAAFAIRGTDLDSMDMSDIYANAQIALRIRPHQLGAADRAYKAALLLCEDELKSGYTLYITGHSLGGALASLLYR